MDELHHREIPEHYSEMSVSSNKIEEIYGEIVQEKADIDTMIISDNLEDEDDLTTLDQSRDNFATLVKEGQEDSQFIYTSFLKNRPPSVATGRFVIFSLWFIIGMIQAYQSSIVMELQEKKASMTDQSKFTYTAYPYFFKILFAPFVDCYFFDKIGKCKTWLVGSLLTLSGLFWYFSAVSESLIQPSSIGSLTALWFLVNSVLVISQIASEMWIIKLFDHEDDKSKATMVLSLGCGIGAFFGLNVFIPLKNVAWLNEHFFTSSPLEKPLLSHSGLLHTAALMCFALACFVLVYISEKMMDSERRGESPFKILKMLPSFFVQKNIKRYLLFLALARVLSAMVSESITLKVIDSGFPSATIVTISTLTFPVMLLASYFSFRFMKKGSLLKISYFMKFYETILTLAYFLIYVDLNENRNKSRTVFLLFILSVASNLSSSYTFLMGFMTTVADEKIGSTFITFILCWCNFFSSFPDTIGLRIIGTGWLSYEFFALTVLILQLILMAPLYKMSKNLDQLGKAE